MSAFDTEKGDFIQSFLEFLNEACTNFHAVRACKSRLLAAGYTEIDERESWSIARGGRYFFTRNGTSIIAFAVGENYSSGSGFTIAAAHTDSPCLKIKAVPCVTKCNSLMINTQPYGGGLWHTWFDRDLGLAGRIVVRTGESMLESRLVDIRRPVARVPNLAIHLTSGKERESFEPNLHHHGKALLTMDSSLVALSSKAGRFDPSLLALVSEAAGVDRESILEMELQLIDTQPSCLGGLTNEFIYSGRLDNLCSSYQCLRALIDSPNAGSDVRVIMLFDHEEVGSSSAQGAGSSMFMDTLKSIHEALEPGAAHGSLMRALRKSFVVSIDMAHALHPNYSDKHDSSMAPLINGGLVIKHNANQRYATNGMSASIFRAVARREGVPVQEFSVRSDAGCGSTVGPIMATLSGILTVDCGSPQFSMHSIREMMGAADSYNGYAHLKAYFKHCPELMSKVSMA